MGSCFADRAPRRTFSFHTGLKAVLAAVVIFNVAAATYAADAASAGAAPSSGTRFRDCPECPEMVVVPPGKFTMARKSASDGRSDDDPEGLPKSAPARQVSIDAPFALGIYLVTREEFASFVHATGRAAEAGCYLWKTSVWVEDRKRSWRDPGFQQSAHDPVVCVNRDDAQAYVRWLNDKLSGTPSHPRTPGLYRLPTWEEAEYAAAGGTATAYYWGSEPRRDRANYGGDDCFPCRPAQGDSDRWMYTSPVGAFAPNPYGLYDMAGNAWQWTQNCVRRSPSSLRWDALDPGEHCTFAAIHGGSWLTDPRYLRVGEYALVEPINRNQTIGFRVARTFQATIPAADDDPPSPARLPTVSATHVSAQRPLEARSSGKRFRDCADCPDMIVIPAGEYTMGSPLAGHGWDTRDVPEHRVTIAKPFAVGVYDVTRAQYRMFFRETQRLDENGCETLDPEGRWITDPKQSWRDPGFRQRDDEPVVCVSWNDAQAYVQWLNTRSEGARPHDRDSPSGPYRLLTEAEWEYAARAGSSTAFYWGSDATHDRENYGLEQCYPCGAVVEGKDQWYFTSPVGSFAPNAFGLYDMSGNVFQWTQDCMHYGYSGAPQDGSAWEGGECKLRVLRGGSWVDPARYTVVTERNPIGPAVHNKGNGFRVARSLD